MSGAATSGRRKLTARQVKAIRASTESCRVLAKRFGVWPQTISLVKRRVTWSSLY